MNISRSMLAITLLCFPIINYCEYAHPDYRFVELFDDEVFEEAYQQGIIEEPEAIELFEGFGSLALPDPSLNTRVLPPQEIIEFLLELGAIAILEEPFYLRTNEFNSRSLLDQPIFEPKRCCYQEGWTIGADIFYNQTDKSKFTASKTGLGSYLALGQETLLEKVENLIDMLRPLFDEDPFNFNVRRVFNILSRMTVQERRMGAMFELDKRWEKIGLRVLWPFYWRERNFSLTPAEKRAIEQEFEPGNPREQEKFQNKHFISDELGFGDLRFEFDFRIACMEKFRPHLGFFGTIPASFAVAKRLRGNTFPRPSFLPTFDFDRLFDLACMTITDEVKEEAFEMVSNFFLCALDRLAANLLDTKLGNRHHPGFGVLFRNSSCAGDFIKHPCAKNFSFRNRLSIEFLFASTEKRMFIQRSDPEAFAHRDFNDPAMAEENLTFLEQELIDKYYLIGFDSKIQPGMIFRWTSKICYEGECFGAYLGNDWWVQGHETIKRVEAPDFYLQHLAFYKARKPLPYQYKIFAGISYKLERPHRTWYLGLNGETTAGWSGGIGEDYTFSFNFEATF